jgi:hypothetical protein
LQSATVCKSDNYNDAHPRDLNHSNYRPIITMIDVIITMIDVIITVIDVIITIIDLIITMKPF